MKVLVLLLIGFSIFEAEARHAIIQESYLVLDKTFLSTIRRQPELTIDHVRPNQFEVYGPRGLGSYLTRIKAPTAPMPLVAIGVKDSYPTPEQIALDLKNIAVAHPTTARLFSIGKSAQGRDLLVMKISRNVGIDDHRPEFKYVANMHGDEIIGRELMTRLIRDLLAQDGRDPWITKLLDDVQIYIMPSMNPDGATAARRANANGYDLNRDFPDFTSDNQNTPEGRQPETQAVMQWQASRKFILSANFHGGAEVVNYPWDTTPDPHPQIALVKALSLDYARRAPYIGSSTVFQNGITNGYDWYEVNGGMQDWSFHWYGDLQLTIELSNTKWPAYDQVDSFYQRNRGALINYIGQIRNLSSFRH